MIERFTKGLVSATILSCLAAAASAHATPARAAGTRAEFRSAELAAAYSAYTRSAATALHATAAIPAFARKYNLACSACHTVWPELNVFGQRFKDNGYQLGDDRDSPIWQNPSYWPVAMRTTPNWHTESTNNQITDASPTGKTVSQAGFDLSGIDILALGTLYKNITFGLVPTIDADGATGVEAAFVRFDNLGNSPWANVKVGKFELDNLLSEKRFTWLSNNGGFLYAYHFLPPGSANDFGMGDNQIGAELSGHSFNDYTRYSVSLLATNDGDVTLPTGKSMDAMVTLSQAWAVGNGLGPQRLGLFGYLGHRATAFETVGGDPIPGTGTANAKFIRFGATAQIWLGNLELIPLVSHSQDDAILGPGTDKPTWNNALIEAHYVATPRLLVQGRYELTRMSKQGDAAIPKTLGNADAFSLGFRAFPFMFSRDGMALHGEFSLTNTTGTAPLSGNGSGLDPLTPDTKVRSLSFMLGFDFAF